ncbi:MAG: 50S ribosomal protein L1 [Planctomycetota bacterium]
MAESEYAKAEVGFTKRVKEGDEAAASSAPVAEAAADKKASDEPQRRRGKLRHRPSKRTKANTSQSKRDPVDAATAMSRVKKFAGPKFDQSVDVVFHLGIDTRQADQQIRGSVSLPKGIGKSKRVVAFCQDDVVAAAKESGAVEAGGEELVAKIEKGWMEFDVAVASPEMMRVISKLGRVLGPKGLMPSPKAGTVTKDVAQAVKDYAAGKVEYRADKSGNVHATIGKMSFPESDLLANFEHLLGTIEKAQPKGLKSAYVKSIHVSGTMTPAVKIRYGGDAEASAGGKG